MFNELVRRFELGFEPLHIYVAKHIVNVSNILVKRGKCVLSTIASGKDTFKVLGRYW